MDPDAALFLLRQNVADYENATTISEREDAADRISELFQGLDEWITKGGFLPKDWQPAHNPSTTD